MSYCLVGTNTCTPCRSPELEVTSRDVTGSVGYNKKHVFHHISMYPRIECNMIISMLSRLCCTAVSALPTVCVIANRDPNGLH
uniref:Uncharacterized protein n=1 Tax=Esox lucius TaxID=8010 RepID=A0A3P8Z312_ESOLU